VIVPRLAADATAPPAERQPRQRPSPPSRPIPVAPKGAPARPAVLDGQERFAAYVAHELRTPIAVQLALVEATLSDPDADAAAYRTMAKHVMVSCEEQQRLIDALLQLTLGRRGLTRHEPVDIAATIGHALRAHDLGEFQTIVALKPARATGDPVLIERLAANLISNAARHNLTGGRIEIETRTENEHAVLCIANTGRLIAARELTRVFEPFHRLERQPRAHDDGLGLGLAIVRAIADAHHATVTAHARADGGLKVAVRFPTTTQRNAPLS
jgi:signal transduction histidine kinase